MKKILSTLQFRIFQAYNDGYHPWSVLINCPRLVRHLKNRKMFSAWKVKLIRTLKRFSEDANQEKYLYDFWIMANKDIFEY